MSHNRSEHFLDTLRGGQSLHFAKPCCIHPCGNDLIPFRDVLNAGAGIAQRLLESIRHIGRAHLDQYTTLRVAHQAAGTVGRDTECLRLIGDRGGTQCARLCERIQTRG